MIFGSEGTAQADFERLEEINREIGLTQMLGGVEDSPEGDGVGSEAEKEKQQHQVRQEHAEAAT